MNHSRMLLIVMLCLSLTPLQGKTTNDTKVIEKEYEMGKTPSVTILNTENGTVDIQKNDNQTTIVVIVTIKTKKEEHLDLVDYIETVEGTTLILTTNIHDDDTVKASVHYQLMVPVQTIVSVENKNGGVTIQDIQGKVCVHVINGDITFTNCSNTMVARIDVKGNINSEYASGHVKAYTKKGKICITNSSRSVLAHTDQGPIVVTAQRVPSRSKITLSSAYGPVILELPEDVNADLFAKSKRGSVICDHEITLKPRTTTLTWSDWKQFKRLVDGTIGSGTSEIRVNSNQNIKIKKYQTA